MNAGGPGGQSEGRGALGPPPLVPKPSSTAIYLSALVYPGAGQVVQRRWVSAVVFGGVGTITFGFFAWNAVKVLIVYYQFAAHFEEATTQVPSVRGVLAWLGVSVVVYLVGLVDTILASRRS